MGRRAGLLLASLSVASALGACVPPAPLAVAGVLPPPSTSYAIVGGGELPDPARAALTQGLAAHGITPTPSGKTPDRLVSVTLADRPRASGTAVGTQLPASRAAPGWVDQPIKEGWFTKGRREVRLSIRFLSPDGKLREERTAHEIVTRKAPAADMAQLVGAALRP